MYFNLLLKRWKKIKCVEIKILQKCISEEAILNAFIKSFVQGLPTKSETKEGIGLTNTF